MPALEGDDVVGSTEFIGLHPAGDGQGLDAGEGAGNIVGDRQMGSVCKVQGLANLTVYKLGEFGIREEFLGTFLEGSCPGVLAGSLQLGPLSLVKAEGEDDGIGLDGIYGRLLEGFLGVIQTGDEAGHSGLGLGAGGSGLHVGDHFLECVDGGLRILGGSSAIDQGLALGDEGVDLGEVYAGLGGGVILFAGNCQNGECSHEKCNKLFHLFLV